MISLGSENLVISRDFKQLFEGNIINNVPITWYTRHICASDLIRHRVGTDTMFTKGEKQKGTAREVFTFD